MDWTRKIDAYCERMGPEFWAEPINAITNGAFIIAGILLLRHAARVGRLDGPVTYLGILICVIGVGSFLFHTFATVWAAFMDTTPITIFILSFFAIALHQFFHLAWWKAGLATIGFFAAMTGLSAILRVTIGHLVGGSQSYFPAFFALIVVGMLLKQRTHPAAKPLFVAAAVFALSLTFRTIDEPLCSAFPHGTHFMWHLLNAVVLGTLLFGLIQHGRAASAARG